MNPKAEFQFLDFASAKDARSGRKSSFSAESASPTLYCESRAMADDTIEDDSRFTPSHAQRAAKIRAEIAEQRSMEPLQRRDKIVIRAVFATALVLYAVFGAWKAGLL